MGGSLTVMLITFPESTHYDFAMQFLQRTNTALLGIQPRSHHLEIETNTPVIARLLQRLIENRPTVFPYLVRTSHSWTIMGQTRRQYNRSLLDHNRFAAPTCTEFPTN